MPARADPALQRLGDRGHFMGDPGEWRPGLDSVFTRLSRAAPSRIGWIRSGATTHRPVARVEAGAFWIRGLCGQGGADFSWCLQASIEERPVFQRWRPGRSLVVRLDDGRFSLWHRRALRAPCESSQTASTEVNPRVAAHPIVRISSRLGFALGIVLLFLPSCTRWIGDHLGWFSLFLLPVILHIAAFILASAAVWLLRKPNRPSSKPS